MRNLRDTLVVVVAGLALTAVIACGDDEPSTSGGKAGAGGTDSEAGAAGSGATAEGGDDGNGGTDGSAGAPDTGGAAGGENVAGAAGGENIAGAGGLGGEGGTGGAPPIGGAGGEAGSLGGSGGATGTGTLTINVNAAPANTTVSLTVLGPDGFSEVITSSTTFADVAAGDYTVLAAPARKDGALVDELFGSSVTDSTPSVSDGQTTTVTVSYSSTKLGGSGMLWASNSANYKILGYNAAQMALEGAITDAPSVVLTMPKLGVATNKPGPIAFDPFTGYLWVGYCGTNPPQTLAAFEPALLAATAKPAATYEIATSSATGFGCVTALAFDARGDLWVGFFGGHFVKYTRDQLDASGAPTPALTFYETLLIGLQDFAFDGGGNLFASVYNHQRVVKYTPAILATSSDNVQADVVWQGSSLDGPTGLAFASDGNLWMADYNTSLLHAFSAVTQGTTGNPTPDVSVSSADAAGPQFLTFDEAGNLWVASYDNSTIARIEAADLDTSAATPAAAVYSSADMDANYSIRLNPMPDVF
jgi:hypothetical protein